MPVQPDPTRSVVRPANDSQAGVDTIETGMRLLLSLARMGGRPQTLSTLADAAAMSPPKAHRYLVSLIRTGLVERDPRRSMYRLGPAALEIGLNAIGGIDALVLATEAAQDLRDELNQTVAVMVWGSRGPLIVRAEESNQIASVSFKIGRELPVMSSASGLCLGAHLPWAVVEPVVRRELASSSEGAAGSPLPEALDAAHHRLESVRHRGMSRIVGTVTPGITALAAPLLDVRGYAAASISVVGPSGTFDSAWDGNVARILNRVCIDLSAQLGYRASARRHEGA